MAKKALKVEKVEKVEILVVSKGPKRAEIIRKVTYQGGKVTRQTVHLRKLDGYYHPASGAAYAL